MPISRLESWAGNGFGALWCDRARALASQHATAVSQPVSPSRFESPIRHDQFPREHAGKTTRTLPDSIGRGSFRVTDVLHANRLEAPNRHASTRSITSRMPCSPRSGKYVPRYTAIVCPSHAAPREGGTPIASN